MCGSIAESGSLKKEKGCTKMPTPIWGNFIILLVLFADTFAIYFLIRKVKALESLDEGDATARIDLGKRIRKLEIKLKSILDED